MFGRVAKTAVGTKTGRRASRAAAKGVWKVGKTKTARKAAKGGVVGAGRTARFAAKTKAGKEAGKLGGKGLAKARRGFGRTAASKGRREVQAAQKNLDSRRSGGSRLLKLGVFALVVVALGVAVSRLLKDEEAGSSFTDAGEGSGVGGDAARDSAYSDPGSGPLIGEERRGSTQGVGEDQPEVEQRIRTRIGEDERTRDMPRVNVKVIDGVAELRGPAPSEEAKDAAGEIAAQIEGVREVRNLIEVGS